MSDSDGTIQSWSWDFGDGRWGDGASPSHTYAMSGTYAVTLTVTDDQGGTDTHSDTVTVVPSGTLDPPGSGYESAGGSGGGSSGGCFIDSLSK